MFAKWTKRVMLPALALSALLLAAPALAQTTTGATSTSTTDSKAFRNLTEQQRVERIVAASATANPNTSPKAEDIQAMRAEGLGWGVIAQKLGLHPSVVGMGPARSTKGTASAKAKSSKASQSEKGLTSGKTRGPGAGDTDGGLGAGGGSGGGRGGGKGGGGGGGGGKK